jgi:hypothetical protein
MRFKVKDKKVYRACWNYLSRIRRKGIEMTMMEFIVFHKRKALDTDILTSRDGSWTKESLCWKDRDAFYKHRSVDGLYLFKSGKLWYSKKHKGSWRSREEAVVALRKGQSYDTFSQVNSFDEF